MGVGQGTRGDNLMSIDYAQAFDAYEAVRHRLPPYVSAGTPPVSLGTLDDLADDFDVFFLDAFGVLNIGERAIPEVPARIAALQAAGKRVLIVSNAAGFPHATLVEKYTRLGYCFDPDDIITSRKSLLAGLDGRRDMHWGLMATRSTGLQDLEGLNMTYIEEDPTAYDRVDGFLMIGSAAWTEERQTLLETALRKRARPVLVGNPDIVAPREQGFSSEPGYFAHRLADQTGIKPEFFGKPFDNIYDLAFKQVGSVDPTRILMVGDSLHTDILGAHSVGIKSALIAGYGFFAGQDINKAMESAKIFPNYVLARP